MATPNLDPRFKANRIQGRNLKEFFTEYRKTLSHALDTLDLTQLELAYSAMKKASENEQTVYVCGNGGSAALSNHLTCDWTKGTYIPGQPRLRTISLVANLSDITAIANDYSYAECFSSQLEMLAHPNDLLIVISSSGNSPNIVRALEKAKELKMLSLAFTGFTGGKAKQLADIKLHVSAQNYAVVEDSHQTILQALGQYFALIRDT